MNKPLTLFMAGMFGAGGLGRLSSQLQADSPFAPVVRWAAIASGCGAMVALGFAIAGMVRRRRRR